MAARRVPNQRVDLCGLDLVHAAHGVSDLPLVRAQVNNEDEGVVVLNLLHSGLSRQGVLEDGVRVKRVHLRHGLARILGVAQQPQSLRAVELGLVPLGDSLLVVSARELLCGALGLFSLSLCLRSLQQRRGGEVRTSKARPQVGRAGRGPGA